MAAIDEYRRGIRSAVRGFWSGVIELGQFHDEMQSVINRRLQQAFEQGAAECGIRPNEFTNREFFALGNAIRAELNRVAGFAQRITDNSKVNGGRLGPLFSQAELWINRFNDLKNQAKVLACGDVKLQWLLGATEIHCRTCPRLHKKVKRRSFWEQSGIRPQNPPNPTIECGGWR